jgi:NAD(P)-dependent dehydrogenase (short-subunit alcohol dehydrogenase family)
MPGERVAVVTGASSGIGAASARRLAGAGFHVVAGARRGDRLQALASEVGATTLALDVTDPDSVAAFAAAVRDRHGHADLLVNNAGTGTGPGLDPIADGRDTDWQVTLRAERRAHPHHRDRPRHGRDRVLGHPLPRRPRPGRRRLRRRGAPHRRRHRRLHHLGRHPAPRTSTSTSWSSARSPRPPPTRSPATSPEVPTTEGRDNEDGVDNPAHPHPPWGSLPHRGPDAGGSGCGAARGWPGGEGRPPVGAAPRRVGEVARNLD